MIYIERFVVGASVVLSESPVYRFIFFIRGSKCASLFIFSVGVWLEFFGAMVMSYEGGPDSLDGGVALFFRLKGCGLSPKEKKEDACYARGVMSEARGKIR